MATQLFPAQRLSDAAKHGQEEQARTSATSARNAWRETPLHKRLAVVRRFRQLVADEAEPLA